MSRYGTGWERLVRDLRDDIDRIAPGTHITSIEEGQYGRLLCYYSDRNLTPQQQHLIDNRVKWAEEVAWMTCAVCGNVGGPAYMFDPPRGRVFCERHKPDNWYFIDNGE